MSATEHDDTAAVTAAELEELRSGLTSLSEAFEELRQASTSRERGAAQEGVHEAREDLEETARRLGVSRKSLEASIAAAKSAERKEELRPILKELLDELRDDDDDGKGKGKADDDDGDGDDDDDKPAPRRRRAAPAAGAREGDPPAGDTGPVTEHWSESSVGKLLR